MHFVDQMTYRATRIAKNSTVLFSTSTVKKSVRIPPLLKCNRTLIALDRELYKTRLEVFFKHYPSKSFDGRPWGELSEIILVRCLNISFTSCTVH
jgi:hypothetical protein